MGNGREEINNSLGALHIDEGGNAMAFNIKITAYDTSDLHNPIDLRLLPKKIKSRYATLIRADLVEKK